MTHQIYYNNNEYIYVIEETFLTNQVFFFNGTNKNNIWEEESLNIFYNIIKNDNRTINKNIIDIGANVGLYSLYAKFLPDCMFYSFEPFKKVFDILNKNIELNNINNVITYNIGLSDKKEKKELKICSTHNGLNTMGNNPLRFNTDDINEVDVDTIDNLFYDNNIEVNYIKIDTEGFEYYILKGAEKTINKYKPIIQIEYNITNMKQCDIEPEKIEKLINQLNYKKAILTGEELIIIPNEYNIINMN